jgi:hypothetical protein
MPHAWVKVKLPLCLTKYHAMKTLGNGGIAPYILYLRGNSPRYPLNRRLCGPERRFGLDNEEKESIIALAGN